MPSNLLSSSKPLYIFVKSDMILFSSPGVFPAPPKPIYNSIGALLFALMVLILSVSIATSGQSLRGIVDSGQ